MSFGAQYANEYGYAAAELSKLFKLMGQDQTLARKHILMWCFSSDNLNFWN